MKESVRWTTVFGKAAAECIAEWDDSVLKISVSLIGQNGWDRVWEPSQALVREANFQRALTFGPKAVVARAVFDAMVKGAASLIKMAQRDPEQAFAQIRHGSEAKPCLAADVVVQCNTVEMIRDGLESAKWAGPEPLIYGEESPNYASLDFSGAKAVVIGLDMLDGTLEFQQNTSLWCSSATIFDAEIGTLVASFVLVPGRGMYCRVGNFVGLCRPRQSGLGPEVFALGGPSSCTDLNSGVLACYAQKSRRHRALLDHPGYRAVVETCENAPRTEGGNPWILRMIDNQGFRLTDAVFELLGQAPHDWVPAAHIATACGVVLTDLRGCPINVASLLARPMSPSSRVPYVLAANREMSLQLLNCLTRDRDNAGVARYHAEAPPQALTLARTA